MYLDKIQEWIALEHDCFISHTSMHKVLHDAGLTCKHLQWATAEQDKEARTPYWDYMQMTFWKEQLVFVDQ